jgi:phosphoribosyl 1,2-cyclic phosphate phosphodiesterase
MSIEITFLGTGTSQGIPTIACDCAVCLSEDPRDKRMRTSALVNLDGHSVLIDTTPDLRFQCLANDIRRVDAVLITHTHADHFLGLDDIRRFTQIQQSPIDLYVHRQHYDSLEKVFGYTQAKRAGSNPDLPHLYFHAVEEPFSLFGYEVIPITLPHGRAMVTGFRIGPLAYCTDVSEIPPEAIAQLKDLELLVLGALRPKPHPAHLTIAQAVEVARRIGAKQTYLVHMSHSVSHREQDALLPDTIRLAYDGLKVRI